MKQGATGGKGLNDDMSAIQGSWAISEGPEIERFEGCSSPTRLCHEVLDKTVPDGITYTFDPCHCAESQTL